MKRITIERDLSSDPIVCHLVQPADSGSQAIVATAAQTRVVRDEFDELLGDREDYKALRRDHAIMARALSENEAAAKVLGIVEGDDFMLAIAQWAKSHREPCQPAALACDNCGVPCSTSLPPGFAFKGQAWCSSCYEARDEEIGRWQNAIRDEVIRLTGCPPEIVDGSGCDSGDPLDLTLTEIGLAINWLVDEHAGENEPPEADPSPDLEATLFGVLVSLGELEDGTAIYQLDVPGKCYRDRIKELARRVVGAAQPSPDLKEALERALRSWRASVGPAHLDGKGEFLRDLMASAFQADRDQSGVVREVVQGQIGHLAGHLAEAVSRVRAISPEEAKAVRLCAREAHAKAAGLVTPERRRVLHAATLVFRVLDRLSGAAGSPESPDPPEGTGSKGEETGVARFDPTDPEAVLDAIIDLGARLARLEQHAGEALHALGTDGVEIRALAERLEKAVVKISPAIDEAVERALRPVAHRLSDLAEISPISEAIRDEVALQTEGLRASVTYARELAASAADSVAGLESRVHALELHRAGLPDGQAELAGLRVTIGGREYRTAPDGSLSPVAARDEGRNPKERCGFALSHDLSALCQRPKGHDGGHWRYCRKLIGRFACTLPEGHPGSCAPGPEL